MEVYFKVTRMTQHGLSLRPLSRLYFLRSWDPEKTYDSLAYYESSRYRNLIDEIKQEFPELSKSDKFKLVFPGADDEDNTIIQSVTDVHIILQLNKKKCTAGETIDLLVLDPSPKSSTNTIDQGDLKEADSISQIQKDIDSAILRILEQMEIKFKQQTAEHETIKKQLATFTQQKNDQSAIILALLKTMDSKIMTQQDASDEIKRLLVTTQQTVTENLATSNKAKTEDSSLLTKLEKMETKMNEQDAEIKNLSHHIINILRESAGSHSAPLMPTQLRNEWIKKNRPQRESLCGNEQQKKHQQNSNQINGHEINLSSTVSESVIETTINPEVICPTIEQSLPGSVASAVVESNPFLMDPFGDIISQMGGQDGHGNDDAVSVKSTVSSNSSSSGSVWIMEDMVESSSKTENIITKDEETSLRHPDALIDGTLEKMLAMGFKDEGGWLTRLLEVKGGDINQVLSVLQIS